MKIKKNSVVTIDYILTDEKGGVLDRSDEQGPLSFIQGIGHVIPGLESALEGRMKGDKFSTSIPSENAYGERRDDLLQVVPRGQFETPDTIEAGMQFEAQTENGMVVFNVIEVDDDQVTVDGNHPLAGLTLNFDVTIVDIRDATEEELSHGHIHGEGGHHHH